MNGPERAIERMRAVAAARAAGLLADDPRAVKIDDLRARLERFELRLWIEGPTKDNRSALIEFARELDLIGRQGRR